MSLNILSDETLVDVASYLVHQPSNLLIRKNAQRLENVRAFALSSRRMRRVCDVVIYSTNTLVLRKELHIQPMRFGTLSRKLTRAA